MNRIILPLTMLAATLASTLPAHATVLTRTFVSSAGSDGNTCTITAPCATFAHAYSLTASDGIVAALDPGKYGPLTITGAITIDGNGWASITAPASGSGITINAGANDGITLIGLKIDGAGAGTNGIVFNTGSALVVQDCAIRNFTNNGINFVPTTQSTLAVSNTVVANNGANGIAMAPNNSGSVVFAGTFNRVEAYNNGTSGFAVIGDLASNQTFEGVNAIAIDCVATGKNYASTSTGFLAASSQGIAVFKLFRSTAVANFIGASAVSTNNAVVAIGLSQSNMELNRGTAGANGTNAVVQSYGDNFTAGQVITGSTTPTE